MVIGVHGSHPTGTQSPATEVIGQDGATVTIRSLPTGVGVVEVPTRSQSIVTNVVMETEDVNTAASIIMVPIPAGVTQATNVGQTTSGDVTVSFICFLFNLVTFQIDQRY